MPIEEIVIIQDTTPDIEVSDLTTKAMNGTGVFDVLMSAIQTRLDEQYSLERIKGTEYSKVYLGSMESAITQGIQFLLGSELLSAQKDKILADIALTRSQILESVAKIALTQAQIEKITAEVILIGLQGEKLLVDTALVQAQIRKIDVDIILTNAQVDKTIQDTAIGVAQESKVLQDTLIGVEQVKKLIADTALTTVQRDKTASEKLLIDQNKSNAVIQGELLELQKGKITAETNLLGQKRSTESAQILDSVDGNAVAGMVGKQKVLLTAQTDGFARKAEQDLSKILADTWSVRRTTDVATAEPTGIQNTDITQVLNKAKAGIGL